MNARRWLLAAAFLVGGLCGALAGAALTRWARDETGRSMAGKKRAKVYVVQRVDWRYRDRSLPLEQSEPPGAGFPLKAFSGREAAAAYCRKLQRRGRKQVNPFAHGKSFPALDDFTSTPTDQFIAWLEQQGVKPPEGELARWRACQDGTSYPKQFDQDSFDAWLGWWSENAPLWDAKRLNRIWDRLDRVRLFEVVEVEAE